MDSDALSHWADKIASGDCLLLADVSGSAMHASIHGIAMALPAWSALQTGGARIFASTMGGNLGPLVDLTGAALIQNPKERAQEVQNALGRGSRFMGGPGDLRDCLLDCSRSAAHERFNSLVIISDFMDAPIWRTPKEFEGALQSQAKRGRLPELSAEELKMHAPSEKDRFLAWRDSRSILCLSDREENFSLALAMMGIERQADPGRPLVDHDLMDRFGSMLHPIWEARELRAQIGHKAAPSALPPRI